MPLSKLLPTVIQLSHEDKLRLIQFLVQAVAQEDGCSLAPIQETAAATLLRQLASTEAVVWSPQASPQAVQALGDLLESTRATANA
jgi:hypothetical protein